VNYPIRIPDQLKPHLRALRKSHSLTQAQLGALVGVKQARIAEIEANPGAVSLDQLTKVLAALGATLHLQAPDAVAAADRRVPDTPSRHVGSTASAPRAADPRSAKPSPADKRSTAPTPTRKPAAPRAGVVIPAKKGTW